MNNKELEQRTRNLNKQYEMKECFAHGLGLFPVNKETREICDCKMKWNEDGTVLSCPICGLDGT